MPHLMFQVCCEQKVACETVCQAVSPELKSRQECEAYRDGMNAVLASSRMSFMPQYNLTANMYRREDDGRAIWLCGDSDNWTNYENLIDRKTSMELITRPVSAEHIEVIDQHYHRIALLNNNEQGHRAAELLRTQLDVVTIDRGTLLTLLDAARVRRDQWQGVAENESGQSLVSELDESDAKEGERMAAIFSDAIAKTEAVL